MFSSSFLRQWDAQMKALWQHHKQDHRTLHHHQQHWAVIRWSDLVHCSQTEGNNVFANQKFDRLVKLFCFGQVWQWSYVNSASVQKFRQHHTVDGAKQLFGNQVEHSNYQNVERLAFYRRDNSLFCWLKFFWNTGYDLVSLYCNLESTSFNSGALIELMCKLFIIFLSCRVLNFIYISYGAWFISLVS